MGKKTNTIHINGQRYDASTGALAAAAPAKKTATKASKPAKRNVDGILKHGTGAHRNVVRHPAKAAKPHATQSSQTLMRHVVKKPSASFKRQHRAVTHGGALITQPTIDVAAKPVIAGLDKQRLQHAKKIAKSHAISRFGSSVADPSPDLLASVNQPAAVATAPAKPKTTADLLEQALAHANSHEQTYQPAHKKARRFSSRKHKIALGTVAGALVIGFMVLQSLTGIRLHVASSKAGFAVATPSYQPAGFRLGDLTYAAGNAGLKYQSNSDQRSYSVIEKASLWDSNALRDQVVEPSGKDYRVIESAGRTIFLDNSHNATWVNGGVWYQIKADGVLSDHQLVQIANSL